MKWVFRFEYVVPRPVEEVYEFFRNVENMRKVWPMELGMKLVSREKDVYTVSFRLLGQRYQTRFRITERSATEQYHETLDFPFGKLYHTIITTPADGGTKIVEDMVLESSNPFAGRFFKKILTYRHEAIKHSLGAAPQPIYKDPFKISLAAGNLISLLGIAAAYILLWLQPLQIPGGRLITGLISFILLWFFTHDLAHYIVGRLAGIRFSNYYIGLSNIVRLNILPKQFKTLPIALGIKIDRANTNASPRGYAAMFAAGPIASMLFPLTVPTIILFNSSTSLAGQTLLLIAIANIIFTSIFSPRAGCFKKAANALKKSPRPHQQSRSP
ncbi:MAG: SRPBCC family protein [Candidatus Caldarchaeum sp.]